MSAAIVLLLLSQLSNENVVVPTKVDATPPVTEPIKPVLPAILSEAKVSAKFGKGATVSSGEFSITVRGRLQLAALSVFAGTAPTTVRQNAFFIRRALLPVKVGLPYKLTMNIQLAFAALDGEPDLPNVLRDFNLDWKQFRDVSVRIGQGVLQFDAQRAIPSSMFQLVDRANSTIEFNLDRDMGLSLFSDDLFGLGERIKYVLGVYGGDGRSRIGTDNGLLYMARVRVSLFGAMDDKSEGDQERKSDFRISIGGAVAHNVSTNRQRSTLGPTFTAARFDYTHATADVHMKWSGLSLSSQFFWRQANVDSKTTLVKTVALTEYSRSGMGYYIQAGAYANSWLEFSGRYGEIFPKEGTDPTFRKQREIGGGVNWFIEKHDLKLQADYFFLDDGAGNNSRHQIRMQLQVNF